jgi:hypothetical protein
MGLIRLTGLEKAGEFRQEKHEGLEGKVRGSRTKLPNKEGGPTSRFSGLKNFVNWVQFGNWVMHPSGEN